MRRFGFLTALVLLGLRLAVGWHFFQEGASKLQGTWSSAGFFSNAKGPLADFYAGLVWDADGRYRLNLDTTLESWDRFRAQVVNHYGLDEAQQKQAARVLEQHEQQLRWVLESNSEEIAKYFRGLERRQQQRARPEMEQVVSLRQQGESLETELRQARGPWLATIDRLWRGYEQQMNAVATPEQAARGPISLERPGRRPFDTEWMDGRVPYFDLLIGVCLILGFCTRPAALAGAGFLALVVSTQWPGAEGAAPTYYQVVELLALLVLAGTGAGRFAGLDYIVEAARLRLFPPRLATQEART
ncbi:MAG: DoxX family membrane protein [Pirellulaceae bacterium]|nr:DoxX family membrane protein [Pirellulaceae bacterium]